MIGEIVGNYQIVRKLSVGGMGTVYQAKHTLIGKLAAVKVLHPELCTNHDIVGRFLKEAQATTTIKHPGIVDVIDFGYMPSGHAFLVMELLDGMSLARRLKRGGRMSEGEAAMLLREVCNALAAAHAKGIVHRDLKPDNIFLVPDPESALGVRPKLLDFGIAKLTAVGADGSTTKTGAVMGTPTYMSPEQCKGTGDVDHRADLYSIGCIYYELVTGRPPFTNLGAGELIGTHIFVDPDPPSTHLASISPDTEALIMALLQKRPERRPQSARELGHRLTALAQQHRWITATAPNGLTAPDLPELAAQTEVGPGSAAGPTTPFGATMATPAAGVVAVTAPPSYSDLVVAPVDKPTTLSGAASQSVAGQRRRPRRAIGLAMLAAAALSGGAVAVVQLTRGPGATDAGATDPGASGAGERPPGAAEPRAAAPAAAPAAPAAPAVTPPPPPAAPPAPAPAPSADPPPPAAPATATTLPAPSPPPATTSPAPASGSRTAARPPAKPAGARPAAPRSTPTKPAPTKPAPSDPKQADPRKLIETELE